MFDICLYKLDSSNKVVFGGDQFLKIWEISTNQIIKTISINDKVLSLDIFSSQIIASGHEDGGVKFWDMTKYSHFKTVNTGSKVNQNSTEIAASNMISFQSSLPSEIKKESTVQSTNEIFMTSTATSTTSAFSQPTSVDKLDSFSQTGSSGQFFLSKNLVFGKVLVNHKIPESFNQFLIYIYSDQLGQCQMFSFISSISYFDQSQGYSN
ncbi:hypothetical protein BpHYR1_024562 [Brachionus plicatilis]|uniref:Uncharacterized protein n=1 Tax=Brachionus plicatilis TaxID=10195 RepID=A0A3M7SXC5_BRAPC|nr:hypothetical protein BpHYR1_024562 [Brachionus plicatilis]